MRKRNNILYISNKISTPKVLFFIFISLIVKINVYSQLFPGGPINGNAQLNNGCNNSGFENANFNYWQLYHGNVTANTGGVNLQSLTQALNPTQHNIVGQPAIDNYGNFSAINCDSYAAKIGDIALGSDNRKASMIKYTFTVNPFNKDFSFRYAMVLENPENHEANTQPFFQYLILKGDRHYFTTASQIITSRKFIANKNDPFFNVSNINGTYVYKDWSTECIDLSNYIGQEVSILFLVGDCAYGAHGAYAYIDCLCEDNKAIANLSINDNDFCKDDQIIIDGSGSKNEDSYFISIMEADQQGNPIPNTETYQWFIAQEASIININNLAAQWNYKLKCNTYYRIKLAVKNSCTIWDEKVELIYIRCPNSEFGPDIFMCCDNITPVAIGDQNFNPNYTYNWSSDPPWGYMILNPNFPSYIYTPYISSTFNVTVTDDYGCTLEDEINIILEQQLDVNIIVEDLGCCRYNLVPEVSFTNECGIIEEPIKWLQKKYGYLNYYWHDGFTTKEHLVSPTQNTTYTLTVSNNCFSKTVSVNIEGCPEFNAPYPRLTFPPLVKSLFSTKNEWLVIHNPSLPIGAPNAYKATRYYLRVWNRWGNLIYSHLSEEYCDGIKNGDIYWNVKTNNNNYIQNGIYVFRLTLFNNTYPYQSTITSGEPNYYKGGLSKLDWNYYKCVSQPPWWCFWCICTSAWVNETNHTLSFEIRN